MKTLSCVNMFNHGITEVQDQLKENNNPPAVFNVSYLTVFSVVVKEDAHVIPSDAQGDTQGDTQGKNLDVWIEEQIRRNPQVTTEELSRLSKRGIATIKRHISKLPHIKYIGSGYSGHWEII